MGYADVFGTAYTPVEQPKEEETANISPLDDTNGEQPPDPLLFAGFSSGRPLLVEKPSLYVSRLAASARGLVTTGENPLENAFVAPSLSLPVVLLGDMVKPLDEDVAKYPLFHFPMSHPLNTDDLYTDQILALILVLYDMEAIHEDEERDLMCYPLPAGFDCTSEKWEAALETAKVFAPVLSTVNLARLALFTLLDPDTEKPYFKELANLWGVTDKVPQLIQEGLNERMFFKETYEDLLEGYEPDPFKEFDGTGLLERF